MVKVYNKILNKVLEFARSGKDLEKNLKQSMQEQKKILKDIRDK